jgi:hypothetical protein
MEVIMITDEQKTELRKLLESLKAWYDNIDATEDEKIELFEEITTELDKKEE